MFLIILGLILILVPCVFVTIYRFNHIDMTSTRIFVNNWPWYIPMIIGAILVKTVK